MDDEAYLREAIEVAGRCSPSTGAFSVGALVVMNEVVIATGYSRETDDAVHAEEAALAKIRTDLTTATIYSSLEPCSKRARRPKTCTQLILEAGIPRIVFAWREPSLFVDCEGAELLRQVGREVIEMPHLADLVKEQNAHLL